MEDKIIMPTQNNSSVPEVAPTPMHAPINESYNEVSMHKSGKTLRIFLILIVVLIIGLIVALTVGKHKTNNIVASKISVTSGGFIPATISVKANTVVTWTNLDSKNHEIAANPYPLDNSIPGFVNTVTLHQGDTLSFTFEKSGTYTYHDQLNPLNKNYSGTIIVK